MERTPYPAPALRRSQNWLGASRPGNAVYVPPPPHVLSELRGNMENFIYAPSDLPPLVRAGLLHVQFETIHPYLDGNGRFGRLLMALPRHPIVTVAVVMALPAGHEQAHRRPRGRHAGRGRGTQGDDRQGA